VHVIRGTQCNLIVAVASDNEDVNQVVQVIVILPYTYVIVAIACENTYDDAAQVFGPGDALLRGPLLGREVVKLVFDSALIAVGFSFPVAGLCGMADRADCASV
jgi:hypothetical protein